MIWFIDWYIMAEVVQNRKGPEYQKHWTAVVCVCWCVRLIRASCLVSLILRSGLAALVGGQDIDELVGYKVRAIVVLALFPRVNYCLVLVALSPQHILTFVWILNSHDAVTESDWFEQEHLQHRSSSVLGGWMFSHSHLLGTSTQSKNQ